MPRNPTFRVPRPHAKFARKKFEIQEDRAVRVIVNALCIGASIVMWGVGAFVMRPFHVHACYTVAWALRCRVTCRMRRRIFCYVKKKTNMTRPSHVQTYPL